MSMRAPYTTQMRAAVPAQATAGTGQTIILGEYQDAALPAGTSGTGTLTEVSILPAAAVAANGTNYRIWTLFNRGNTGVGTTSMATLDTSTVALVDNDERLMTLSGTPANLVVTTDDVLELVETTAGTGVAHAGYTVIASIART